MNKTIVKALVGSRAHKLHREDRIDENGNFIPGSDVDWRGVFIAPASLLLQQEPFGEKVSETSWIEGVGSNKTDDTSYELGHFLKLALASNPSILELLASDLYEILTPEGEELRSLLPHMWTATKVRDAFGGYSNNQLKKMLENKDGRRWDYAKHYLRTLVMGINLLATDTLSLEVPVNWRNLLIDVRDGLYTEGRIIDIGQVLRDDLNDLAERRKDKVANVEPIREFYLRMRKENW